MRSIKLLLTGLSMSSLLAGCMAAPMLVGTTLGGEMIAGEYHLESRMTGKQIKATVGNTLIIPKETKSLSGIEKWMCSDQLKEVKGVDLSGDLFLCVDPKDIKQVYANSTVRFTCHEGKGGALTSILNKNSYQTVYCRIGG